MSSCAHSTALGFSSESPSSPFLFFMYMVLLIIKRFCSLLSLSMKIYNLQFVRSRCGGDGTSRRGHWDGGRKRQLLARSPVFASLVRLLLLVLSLTSLFLLLQSDRGAYAASFSCTNQVLSSSIAGKDAIVFTQCTVNNGNIETSVADGIDIDFDIVDSIFNNAALTISPKTVAFRLRMYISNTIFTANCGGSLPTGGRSSAYLLGIYGILKPTSFITIVGSTSFNMVNCPTLIGGTAAALIVFATGSVGFAITITGATFAVLAGTGGGTPYAIAGIAFAPDVAGGARATVSKTISLTSNSYTIDTTPQATVQHAAGVLLSFQDYTGATAVLSVSGGGAWTANLGSVSSLAAHYLIQSNAKVFPATISGATTTTGSVTVAATATVTGFISTLSQQFAEYHAFPGTGLSNSTLVVTAAAGASVSGVVAVSLNGGGAPTSSDLSITASRNTVLLQQTTGTMAAGRVALAAGAVVACVALTSPQGPISKSTLVVQDCAAILGRINASIATSSAASGSVVVAALYLMPGYDHGSQATTTGSFTVQRCNVTASVFSLSLLGSGADASSVLFGTLVISGSFSGATVPVTFTTSQNRMLVSEGVVTGGGGSGGGGKRRLTVAAVAFFAVTGLGAVGTVALTIASTEVSMTRIASPDSTVRVTNGLIVLSGVGTNVRIGAAGSSLTIGSGGSLASAVTATGTALASARTCVLCVVDGHDGTASPGVQLTLAGAAATLGLAGTPVSLTSLLMGLGSSGGGPTNNIILAESSLLPFDTLGPVAAAVVLVSGANSLLSLSGGANMANGGATVTLVSSAGNAVSVAALFLAERTAVVTVMASSMTWTSSSPSSGTVSLTAANGQDAYVAALIIRSGASFTASSSAQLTFFSSVVTGSLSISRWAQAAVVLLGNVASGSVMVVSNGATITASSVSLSPVTFIDASGSAFSWVGLWLPLTAGTELFAANNTAMTLDTATIRITGSTVGAQGASVAQLAVLLTTSSSTGTCVVNISENTFRSTEMRATPGVGSGIGFVGGTAANPPLLQFGLLGGAAALPPPVTVRAVMNNFTLGVPAAGGWGAVVVAEKVWHALAHIAAPLPLSMVLANNTMLGFQLFTSKIITAPLLVITPVSTTTGITGTASSLCGNTLSGTLVLGPVVTASPLTLAALTAAGYLPGTSACGYRTPTKTQFISATPSTAHDSTSSSFTDRTPRASRSRTLTTPSPRTPAATSTVSSQRRSLSASPRYSSSRHRAPSPSPTKTHHHRTQSLDSSASTLSSESSSLALVQPPSSNTTKIISRTNTATPNTSTITAVPPELVTLAPATLGPDGTCPRARLAFGRESATSSPVANTPLDDYHSVEDRAIRDGTLIVRVLLETLNISFVPPPRVRFSVRSSAVPDPRSLPSSVDLADVNCTMAAPEISSTSSGGHLALFRGVACQFPPSPRYTLAGAETITVHVFTLSTTQPCAQETWIAGSFTVVPAETPSLVVAAQVTTTVTASASLVSLALLVEATPIEVQVLTLMFLSACASGADLASVVVIRYFVSPFVHYGPVAMTVGNVLLAVVVAGAHGVVVWARCRWVVGSQDAKGRVFSRRGSRSARRASSSNRGQPYALPPQVLDDGGAIPNDETCDDDADDNEAFHSDYERRYGAEPGPAARAVPGAMATLRFPGLSLAVAQILYLGVAYGTIRVIAGVEGMSTAAVIIVAHMGIFYLIGVPAAMIIAIRRERGLYFERYDWTGEGAAAAAVGAIAQGAAASTQTTTSTARSAFAAVFRRVYLRREDRGTDFDTHRVATDLPIDLPTIFGARAHFLVRAVAIRFLPEGRFGSTTTTAKKKAMLSASTVVPRFEGDSPADDPSLLSAASLAPLRRCALLLGAYGCGDELWVIFPLLVALGVATVLAVVPNLERACENMFVGVMMLCAIAGVLVGLLRPHRIPAQSAATCLILLLLCLISLAQVLLITRPADWLIRFKGVLVVVFIILIFLRTTHIVFITLYVERRFVSARGTQKTGVDISTTNSDKLPLVSTGGGGGCRRHPSVSWEENDDDDDEGSLRLGDSLPLSAMANSPLGAGTLLSENRRRRQRFRFGASGSDRRPGSWSTSGRSWNSSSSGGGGGSHRRLQHTDDEDDAEELEEFEGEGMMERNSCDDDDDRHRATASEAPREQKHNMPAAPRRIHNHWYRLSHSGGSAAAQHHQRQHNNAHLHQGRNHQHPPLPQAPATIISMTSLFHPSSCQEQPLQALPLEMAVQRRPSQVSLLGDSSSMVGRRSRGGGSGGGGGNTVRDFSCVLSREDMESFIENQNSIPPRSFRNDDDDRHQQPNSCRHHQSGPHLVPSSVAVSQNSLSSSSALKRPTTDHHHADHLARSTFGGEGSGSGSGGANRPEEETSRLHRQAPLQDHAHTQQHISQKKIELTASGRSKFNGPAAPFEPLSLSLASPVALATSSSGVALAAFSPILLPLSADCSPTAATITTTTTRHTKMFTPTRRTGAGEGPALTTAAGLAPSLQLPPTMLGTSLMSLDLGVAVPTGASPASPPATLRTEAHESESSNQRSAAAPPPPPTLFSSARAASPLARYLQSSIASSIASRHRHDETTISAEGGREGNLGGVTTTLLYSPSHSLLLRTQLQREHQQEGCRHHIGRQQQQQQQQQNIVQYDGPSPSLSQTPSSSPSSSSMLLHLFQRNDNTTSDRRNGVAQHDCSVSSLSRSQRIFCQGPTAPGAPPTQPSVPTTAAAMNLREEEKMEEEPVDGQSRSQRIFSQNSAAPRAPPTLREVMIPTTTAAISIQPQQEALVEEKKVAEMLPMPSQPPPLQIAVENTQTISDLREPPQPSRHRRQPSASQLVAPSPQLSRAVDLLLLQRPAPRKVAMKSSQLKQLRERQQRQQQQERE